MLSIFLILVNNKEVFSVKGSTSSFVIAAVDHYGAFITMEYLISLALLSHSLVSPITQRDMRW